MGPIWLDSIDNWTPAVARPDDFEYEELIQRCPLCCCAGDAKLAQVELFLDSVDGAWKCCRTV
jgi:hypothetical protein